MCRLPTLAGPHGVAAVVYRLTVAAGFNKLAPGDPLPATRGCVLDGHPFVFLARAPSAPARMAISLAARNFSTGSLLGRNSIATIPV